MNRAIFIDKDGTLIKDVPYNVDPALIDFEDYAFESLYLLQQKGYYVIIVSNQPGIALGYFKEEELMKVQKKIKDLLLKHKVMLNGFYYCPHAAEDSCNCRKPKPGLFFKAATDLHIDLSKSWMIGDILNDVEAGKKSDCKTILIDNGNETEWIWSRQRMPDYIAKHLKAAAEIIMLHSS
ncbi:MAG: D-glycero-alpha-D-manno-heptose-1,7-bisphosphate 7-phosphatase [Ginsengibacter sp.]